MPPRSSDYYNPYQDEPQNSPDEQTAAETAPAPETSRQRQNRTRQSRDTAARATEPAAATSRTSSSRTAGGSLRRVLSDRRLRLFTGVVLMLLALFALVSAFSAFIHSGEDQAKVLYNSVGQIVDTGAQIKNAAGPAGAFLGNLLLTETLGIGSLAVIFYVGAIGASLVGLMRFRFWSLTFKCLILAITLSLIIGLITFGSSGVITWGGHHGYYVNKLLIDYTSPFGAICVSLAMLTLVTLLFLTQLIRLINAYRRKMASIRERRAQAQSRAEAKKRRVEAEMQQSPIADGDDTATTAEDVREEQAAEETTDPFELSEDPETDEFTSESSSYEPVFATTSPDNVPEQQQQPTLSPADEFIVETNAIEEAESITTDTYDPTAELSRFRFPSIDLLVDRAGNTVTIDTEEQEENKERIIKALEQFNIKISSIKATVGPTITLFEVVPAEGQRIAAIKRVEEDLALALKAHGIRIIGSTGNGTIGIEVPNNDPQIVSMRSIISSRKFQECRHELPMALGATISNDVFIADLTKMPHLLVAGATGQGKSVGLNAIITSLLYKKHPAELKFVLVDPKMVEFSLYRVLERHYLAKLPDEEDAVITDPNKVVATLNSLCVEMDQRYSLLSAAGCRGIKEYNQKFIGKHLNPEKGHRYMPYIVLIVDEFADLIMTAGKEVEAPICRLAQKARAVGIHVIIATQRPSTNVITGLIKANFPGRIAFRVSQMVDSKTILDRSGAHQLVGKGDMFFYTNGNLERVQCAFIDTPEVEAICECISEQPGYPTPYLLPDYVPDVAEGGAAFGGMPGSSYDRDPLFAEAAQFIVQSGTASTSSLQRRYAIGYNRAGKLMDQLEAAGIVGPASGSKPRAVLVDPMTLDQMI